MTTVYLRLDISESYPDLCPNCLREGSLELDEPAKLKITSSHGSPSHDWHDSNVLFSSIADSLWKRAESDPANNKLPEAFATKDPIGPPRLTKKIVKKLYQLLTCAFWKDVTQQRSPTPFQRLLLVQIREYIFSYRMQDGSNSHFLNDGRIKPLRPGMLMRMVTPVDLGSLSEEDRSCNICKETLGEPNEDGVSENPIKTSCQHVFGEICLSSWITDSTGCPYCRGELLSDTEAEIQYRVDRAVLAEEQSVPAWILHIIGIDPQAENDDDLQQIRNGGLIDFLTDQYQAENEV